MGSYGFPLVEFINIMSLIYIPVGLPFLYISFMPFGPKDLQYIRIPAYVDHTIFWYWHTGDTSSSNVLLIKSSLMYHLVQFQYA